MSSEQQGRTLGQIPALAYVVGTVVGTGIYLKPALIAKLTSTPWQALLLWLVGGIFVSAGALVYSHLARAWPDLGGAYLYLHRVYGPWAAALLLAADIFLARPAAVGALATGLGLVWGLKALPSLLLAVLVLGTIVLLQLLGSRAQGRGQAVLTLLQTVPLVFIVLAGVGKGSSRSGFAEGASGQVEWATAFLAVLWAYDGWYNLTNLAGEVKDPERVFPRALVGGTALVTVLYLVLNGILFRQMPSSEIAAQPVPFLTLFQGWNLPQIGLLLQIALSVALLATLNGTMACGSRVLVAASQDGLIRRDLGTDATGFIPTISFGLWCVGFLALFGGMPLRLNLFDTLTELTSVVVVLLTSLTVTCLFHGDKLKRRVPIYVYAVALAYLSMNLGLAYLLVQEANRTALFGVGSVIVVGSLLWLVRRPTSNVTNREDCQEHL